MAKLRADALKEKPRLIIAGYSAYPWTIDWSELPQIADECGAFLLADIAHPAGLVAPASSRARSASRTSSRSRRTRRSAARAAPSSSRPIRARAQDRPRRLPGRAGRSAREPDRRQGGRLPARAGDDFKRLMKGVRENAAALAPASAAPASRSRTAAPTPTSAWSTCAT
jgi:hypothetical protein